MQQSTSAVHPRPAHRSHTAAVPASADAQPARRNRSTSTVKGSRPRHLPRRWLITAVTVLIVISPSCGRGDLGVAPKTSPTGSVQQPVTSTLPGEVINTGPAAGQVLGVVGVPFDDVLNVRAAPGADQRIVARLDPLADDVVATGTARQLTGSIWYEVTVKGVAGWANSSFVAWLAGTDDVTAQVVAALGGRPSAPTMLDLGRVVAEAKASAEPPSRVTVTVASSTGDLGEVTYDVVGLADDSVFGERLHVFGRPLNQGQGFSLASVERRLLCARGATDNGLCV